MDFVDIIFVLQWWLVFFVIGIIFLPLTIRIFSNFFDKGYIFSKILGIALISYTVFLLGILKIAPFTEVTIFIIILVYLILNILISKYLNFSKLIIYLKGIWKIILFEEFLFLATLFFWSYIRTHEPSIHGLEKYMDFGFINSILRSEYFPPTDMWFSPLPINYYYFGHLVTAVLTKISMIPSFVTYNLMLSTIFAFTFTGAFSIGANLIYHLFLNKNQFDKKRAGLPAEALAKVGPRAIIAGLITGFLISMAGNLHTIYTLFKPYVNENPIPFWQLAFALDSFPNNYWYPNATRFIENTIHEFPIYSSVVSDLHGHYLDVPFVLLTIAVLLSFMHNVILKAKPEGSPPALAFGTSRWRAGRFFAFQAQNDIWILLLLAFLLAVMYMTNAWDGIIYFLLTALTILFIIFKPLANSNSREIKNEKLKIKNSLKIENLKLKIASLMFCMGIIVVGFFVFSLPFNLHFKPFASGIGILCAPEFLTKICSFGPLLFEADHCQHSLWWQMTVLYGFFYFWAISFIIFLSNKRIVIPNLFRDLGSSKTKILKLVQNDNHRPDLFVLLLILFSTFLIIVPEFIYVKDIYPGHYRANTMFKLVYQAFIMLSIASGYIVVRLLSNWRMQNARLPARQGRWKVPYWIIGSIGLFLVMIYPYFAINSYYADLKTYHGLDGLEYLKTLYPTDYDAIMWINENIKAQPVILEAQGDSYTDYGRVSTNTGLPTVLGWTVHEWLWRGTYDIPAPRIAEAQTMYESEDLEQTKSLLEKHNVSLVFFGDLERDKYPNLNENKFKTLGKIIYENGETKIYQLN